MNAGVVLPGEVQDRPLEQLRGRERLQYTGRRIEAYLMVLLTEPSKLGLYPTLRLLPFFAVGGMALAVIVDVAIPGPGSIWASSSSPWWFSSSRWALS